MLHDSTERKKHPVYSGVVSYFPDAMMAVAYVSWLGHQQHNPGEEGPCRWAREKSWDQMDAAQRHLLDRLEAKFDVDGGRHLAKAIWRLMAQLQLEIEDEKANAS